VNCSRAAAAVLLLPLFVNAQEGSRELSLTVGKSLVVDSPVNVERVSVADARVLEAVAVTPREVVLNGLVPGQTSFLLWQQGGNRLLFDVTVRPNTTKQEGVRRQLEREMEGQSIDLQVEDNSVYLRGTVNDLVSMNRAVAIASVLGKPINLLQVKVPPPETQILLKVKFADVDRAATSELGVNLISTGAFNTPATLTTGQI
jgi:pilus assembly protein CpaC